MKFLCDNCKAKYQIADEKVAGKTVRMKCRKCGHQIEVRAAVTESTSLAPPARPGLSVPTSGGLSPLAAPPPRPPVPARPLATSLSQTKPKAPSAPAGALAGAFQRNLSDAPDASVPDAQQEGTGPLALSVSDEWYVAINGVPVGPVRISELRRKAATGAVTEDSLCWQEGLEEWRPIKSIPELATLVREAAQGGMRPSMVSAPDIPPSVRSNIPPGVSARPPMPSAPSFSSPQGGALAPAAPNFDATAAMPMPPGAMPAGTRPLAPPAPLATGRNNVVPIRPAPSNERASDDFGLGLGLGAAATAAAPSLAPQQPMFSQAPATSPLAPPITVPSPVADPFAVPPPPAGAGSLAPLGTTPPINAPGYHESAPPIAPVLAPPVPAQQQPPPRSVPLWFWPVLLLALGFGGGLAFIAFRPAPAPAPVVIQVPATATATAAPSATVAVDKGDIPPPPPAGETTPNEPGGGKTASAAKPGAKVAAAAKPTADTPQKAGGLDLGGLVPGAGGPNVNAGSSSGGGGGGGLDQAGVERVVAAHRAGVKRTCWERGGADQKSSVNVTINATVAPNGSVASTSSSGDDPVVAKCIENQVKSWQFSAPGASQQIAIPFKFVRQ